MNARKVQFSELPNHRTPIFNYCRQLIKEGVDPNTRLECYRNHDEPDVAIRIGEGAKLTVIEDDRGPPRFATYRAFPQDRPLKVCG